MFIKLFCMLMRASFIAMYWDRSNVLFDHTSVQLLSSVKYHTPYLHVLQTNQYTHF